MNVATFKEYLKDPTYVSFRLPDKKFIPPDYHLTELGVQNKVFVDCGGKIRTEQTAIIQIWVSDDTNHRLSSKKMLSIIEHAEKVFDLKYLKIQVEYQTDTVGKYELDFTDGSFVLVPTTTKCLAEDVCFPEANSVKSCQPGSGCCS